MFNIAAIIIFGSYVLFQLISGHRKWRDWGWRTDNIHAAFKSLAPFTLLSAVGLYGIGIWLGHTPLPQTAWLTLLLYLAWGLFQQFALQNFVARHLASMTSSRGLTAILSGVIFSIAHAPELPLMALTLAAGIPLTWYYAKTPNLWIIGLAHGLLGTLAFYCVLGIDPIALAAELQLIPSAVLP